MNGFPFVHHLRRYPLILALLAVGCTTPRTPTATPAVTDFPRAGETLVVTTATPTANRPYLLPVETPTFGQDQGEAHNTIAAALKKIQQAGPLQIHAVTITEDGKSVTIEAVIILPDRYHITTPNAEIVIVGDQAYTRQKTGWVKTTPDLGNLISRLIGNLSDQAILNITDPFLSHSEMVDGIATNEYRYRTSIDMAGEAVAMDNQIWIDATNGLPIRLESTGEYAGVQSTTVQKITYDRSLKIELPTP
ncbi:MAG TPA: hypothetical protein VGJ97_12825 [Anaerolineaceae bacterium]